MKKPKLPKINRYVAEDLVLILLAALVIIGVIIVASNDRTQFAPDRAENIQLLNNEAEN